MSKKKYRRGPRKKGNWFTRMSPAKRTVIILLVVILLLAGSGTAYVANKLNKIDTQKIDAESLSITVQAKKAAEGYTNVALFGVDSREGELDKGTRTDCIIVASLNNKTKEINMISVYRDSLLDIANGELQKCNAAYAYGGPQQAINMLNKNLDLDIEKYITVDFGVVAEVIDLLGGVKINIKDEEIEYINYYMDETGDVAGKKAHHLTHAGVQKLDGVQATTYARIRSTAGGDFTRTERQRLVIEKMAEKLGKSNWKTIDKIIDKVFPMVSTNFTAGEIVSYGKDFSRYRLGESQGFPFDKTTDTLGNRGSVVIPVTLESNVEDLHHLLYADEEYEVSPIVQDINSSIIELVGDRVAVE